VTRLPVAAYLDHIGVEDPGSPSLESLRRLHRAHVERIPFDNLDIQLGRRTTVDPVETAERIVGCGRGGYCFHLNGAFSELLLALGYRATRHPGGVQRADQGGPAITGKHMTVTVSGLPDEACPTGVWMVDVGLGSALHEPLPLHEGSYRQGPFSYALRPSDAEADAWRLDHAPSIGFLGMDFRGSAARIDEFAAMHEHLSTAPDSPFVRVATVQRRHEDGADVLRGTILTRFGATAPSVTTIEGRDEWFAVLREVFGLGLQDVGSEERAALWDRVAAAHAAYATSP
jgi:arylamine N-acetyltransferase